MLFLQDLVETHQVDGQHRVYFNQQAEGLLSISWALGREALTWDDLRKAFAYHFARGLSLFAELGVDDSRPPNLAPLLVPFMDYSNECAPFCPMLVGGVETIDFNPQPILYQYAIVMESMLGRVPLFDCPQCGSLPQEGEAFGLSLPWH